MRKTVSFILLIFGIYCLVSCSNPNIDRRLVGKWENELSYRDDTYTFKANGDFERVELDGETFKGKYTAKDGIITFDFGDEYKKTQVKYAINEDINDSDYGDLRINNHTYYEKVK